LGTIPSGESSTKLSIAYEGTAEGAIISSLNVKGEYESYDPDPANNSRTLSLDVLGNADLMLEASAQDVGGKLQIIAKVYNNGPSALSDFTLELVPSGPDLESVYSAKGDCTMVAEQASCVYGSLANSALFVSSISIVAGSSESIALEVKSPADTNLKNNKVSIDLNELPDTDGDGTVDVFDDDDDGDGVADAQDAFRLDGTESLDTDGDGIGNEADDDDDGDGFSDAQELIDGTDPLSRYSCQSGCFSFDVDGDSDAKALSDGLLVIRHLFGFTDQALVSGATAEGGSRLEAIDITGYLNDAETQLDIDGNGESKALTDGLLLIRYLFGFRDSALVSGAIGDGATRVSPEEIEAYINARIPGSD